MRYFCPASSIGLSGRLELRESLENGLEEDLIALTHRRNIGRTLARVPVLGQVGATDGVLDQCNMSLGVGVCQGPSDHHFRTEDLAPSAGVAAAGLKSAPLGRSRPVDPDIVLGHSEG